MEFEKKKKGLQKVSLAVPIGEAFLVQDITIFCFR
jgi:hypothetical protein